MGWKHQLVSIGELDKSLIFCGGINASQKSPEVESPLPNCGWGYKPKNEEDREMGEMGNQFDQDIHTSWRILVTRVSSPDSFISIRPSYHALTKTHRCSQSLTSFDICARV